MSSLLIAVKAYKLRVEAATASKKVPPQLATRRIVMALIRTYGGEKQPSTTTSNGAQAILSVDAKTLIADLKSEGWTKASWVSPSANVLVKGELNLTISKAKGSVIVDITY